MSGEVWFMPPEFTVADVTVNGAPLDICRSSPRRFSAGQRLEFVECSECGKWYIRVSAQSSSPPLSGVDGREDQ